ncbi:MAG: hypothetical protein EOS03_13580 [Mesorhizobium sp.]|uniref:hypothetical protein n=1 Tax=Mesorhizobium sp. TaxID=1871066 RepID=UPI000FE66EAE|nr:hypothetical protein [Mesorhizobium sp.]RWN47372.1 MAG: hypothetical protein EOS03_13580 [Mesorhizobium sp.]
MTQIDHNPKESRPTNMVWWVLAAVLLYCWGVFWYFGMVSWPSVALGAFTAGVFVMWAIEISGNKWPFSPPGRR